MIIRRLSESFGKVITKETFHLLHKMLRCNSLEPNWLNNRSSSMGGIFFSDIQYHGPKSEFIIDLRNSFDLLVLYSSTKWSTLKIIIWSFQHEFSSIDFQVFDISFGLVRVIDVECIIKCITFAHINHIYRAFQILHRVFLRRWFYNQK